MELKTVMIMDKITNQKAYSRAKEKVNCLRKFYTHLTLYLVVNVLISSFKIYRNLSNGESFEEAFLDFNNYFVWLFWGIGLLIHAFSVFGIPMILGKNWEEEKIRKYMDDNDHNRWQ